MKGGYKIKYEDFEDGYKAPKVFMLHAISNGQQIEQVGKEELRKDRVSRGRLLDEMPCFGRDPVVPN